ncbi:MAG: LacI family DNA-binding transcriptional regulator [Caldilineaceae bacterium]|nr:LacI family DNA-binding transcriptional regulator [Caldilineaceae bacterium]
MDKKATLKDVAAKSGVSYQTVSKVLNGKANVSAETERAIWQAVEDLDYRTNAAGRNLRTQASRLIGYTWTPAPPWQPNPILDSFLSSTIEAADAAGYHLLLFPTHNTDDETETYRTLARTGRVDGFIVASMDYDDPRVLLLQKLNFPFVAFGRANADWEFPFVDVDGRAGVAAATRHLIEQGHTRLALLAWDGRSRTGDARRNGYFQAMEEAGLSINQDWVVQLPGDVEAGIEATKTLLSLPAPQRPTAVVTVDDQLAIGAMRAAQSAGLLVGPDFGVTGFDDTPGIQHYSPPLTSLRQPLHEVGREIVTRLIALIEGRTIPESIILPPKLVVRGSSLRSQ